MRLDIVDSQGEAIDYIDVKVDLDFHIAIVYGAMLNLESFLTVYSVASRWPKQEASIGAWKYRYDESAVQCAAESYYDGLQEYEL